MKDRPDWDEYFLIIAQAVATRADCSRREVGAVIVKNHRIVSTGYNGAPAGDGGCLSGACPRGAHFRERSMGVGCPEWSDVCLTDWCHCGGPWPCPHAVEPGSQYESGGGSCIAIHAEANALLYASRDQCEGASIYITSPPCSWCSKLIAGAGITRVIYPLDGGIVIHDDDA